MLATWVVSPHHSWITTTPGPEPDSGNRRYPKASPAPPGNRTFCCPAPSLTPGSSHLQWLPTTRRCRRAERYGPAGSTRRLGASATDAVQGAGPPGERPAQPPQYARCERCSQSSTQARVGLGGQARRVAQGGQPRLGQVDLFDLFDHLGQGHLSAPDLTQVAQL